MGLVVYVAFENYYKEVDAIIKMFKKYNVDYEKVYYGDLDFFLKNNTRDVDIFIIGGSKRRILRDGIIPSIDKILKMPTPVMGICYGFQYMVMRSGGVLEDGKKVKKDPNKKVVVDGKTKKLWVNHNDAVKELPKKWEVDLKVEEMIYMAHTEKWIGYQFHPEFKKETFEEYILPFVEGTKTE